MNFEEQIRLLNGFHSVRVLVLGDVMLDSFVYGTVERISPEAPIPVVKIEKAIDMPGGAANVARNVAALGAQCTLVGVVGQDTTADALKGKLALTPSINMRLVADSSRPTSLKTRYVADGQQVMRADREHLEPLSTDVARRVLEEFAESLGAADIVVLSDYGKGVLSDAVTREAISLAQSAKKNIVVDPKAKDFKKYAGATVLTPNRLELQAACGSECVTDAQVADHASRLLDKTCDVMVVTRGKDGMSVIEAARAVHLPTFARQVFDVSGAGDTVVAALALGIAAGGSVVDSAAIANRAAGVVVGKRGTATVTTGEIVASIPSYEKGADPLKIYSIENVLNLVREWRNQGLKIAFTNGCFDLLHPGHVSLLEQARRSADRLVVGLNADLSIRRLKGPSRPVQSEVARANVLAALRPVDAVVIFSEDTPLLLIEALTPDVLVKGADYALNTVVGAEHVLKNGGRVVLAQLVEGHSTTETVKRAARS
jgi:D-beta-D-heptose 7-phosphate kinase/D-beta-D-heptose 1-phosphate adenosyltransferase